MVHASCLQLIETRSSLEKTSSQPLNPDLEFRDCLLLIYASLLTLASAFAFSFFFGFFLARLSYSKHHTAYLQYDRDKIKTIIQSYYYFKTSSCGSGSIQFKRPLGITELLIMF